MGKVTDLTMERRSINFCPAIECPHCHKINHPYISGWGGQLSTRIKACRHCGTQYTLVVYAEASTEKDIVLHLEDLRRRLKVEKVRLYEKENHLEGKIAEIVHRLKGLSRYE